MNINQKCINELRLMSASVISNAKSGHTGSSVGAATILYSLFNISCLNLAGQHWFDFKVFKRATDLNLAKAQ